MEIVQARMRAEQQVRGNAETLKRTSMISAVIV